MMKGFFFDELVHQDPESKKKRKKETKSQDVIISQLLPETKNIFSFSRYIFISFKSKDII